MKKIIYLMAFILMICSCSQNTLSNSTGMISFSVSRGIQASVSYPSLTDKTWTVTARKTDGGQTIGAGTYEDVLLTDQLGPFSTGGWEFTLKGYDSDTLVFEGTTTETIRIGNNPISVQLHTTGSQGTFSLEECNFSRNDRGAVTKVILKLDGNDTKSWTYMQMTTEDNDLYIIPTYTTKLDKGVHTMQLRFIFESGDFSDDVPISFRIDNGATTHITTGLTDGNLTLNVTLEMIDPVVM